MIDGLKLTIPGEKLRVLLEAQIQRHEQGAARWAREQRRTPEDETEETPLLPDHICRNEAERHVWRAEVLAFIRDHVEAGATYRLAPADLEFGELLPRAPAWLIQDQYEERTRVGFALERITKAVDGLSGVTHRMLANCDASEAELAQGPEDRNETDLFRSTRLDIDNGPEVIVIERK